MDGKTIKRLKTFLLAWLSTPIHAYSFPIQRGSVASSVAQLKASNHSQQFSVQAHRMALLHLGCRKFFLPARWATGDYQHLSQSTLSKITRTTSSIFQSEIDNQQVKRTRNYLLLSFSFQSCLDGNIYWEKSCQSSVITSTHYWNMPSMIEVDCFLKKLRAKWMEELWATRLDLGAHSIPPQQCKWSANVSAVTHHHPVNLHLISRAVIYLGRGSLSFCLQLLKVQL